MLISFMPIEICCDPFIGSEHCEALGLQQLVQLLQLFLQQLDPSLHSHGRGDAAHRFVV